MADELKLPKPEVYRVVWDGAPGWTQYHDERDPLPGKWDDEPPDETMGFYSGDQMRQALLAERERVLRIVRNWHTLRDASGRLSPAGEEITKAIRQG